MPRADFSFSTTTKFLSSASLTTNTTIVMFAPKLKQDSMPAITSSVVENAEPVAPLATGPIETPPSATGSEGGIKALLSGAMENKYVLSVPVVRLIADTLLSAARISRQALVLWYVWWSLHCGY